MTAQPDTTAEPDQAATDPDYGLPDWANQEVLGAITDELIVVGVDTDPPIELSAVARFITAALTDAGLVITADPNVIIEHYRDTAGDYRWRAIDTHNGLTIADSAEGYRTRSHAHHMANRLFPTATTTEV